MEPVDVTADDVRASGNRGVWIVAGKSTGNLKIILGNL